MENEVGDVHFGPRLDPVGPKANIDTNVTRGIPTAEEKTHTSVRVLRTEAPEGHFTMVVECARELRELFRPLPDVPEIAVQEDGPRETPVARLHLKLNTGPAKAVGLRVEAVQ